MNNEKILIASDLHGDAACTDQLLARLDAEGAELCILLGDLLYHGPRNDLPAGYAPKRSIELLNAVRDRLLCVRGNCDTEVDQMVLNFPVLADYAVIVLGGKRVYLTHGHKWNAENPLPMAKGDLMLCGHTHVPTVIPFGDGNRYLNPGSVSIPKEQSPKSYMVYENGVFEWKRLENGEVYRTEAL
ncbi:MAG: phosphodiesterase [Clostridia bacterium]|nr:phosphodiesterase [Clostridia bacterium]MBR2908707.1 phosphodiesterase [Clostridia bacterium]